MKKTIALSALTLLVALSSCIKNDIPYPIVYGHFLSFVVRGELSGAAIDTEKREVLVNLSDTVNPKRVKITSYTLTEETAINPALGEYIDLTVPQEVILHTFQEYKWVIRGVQTINRSFMIEHQVGDAIIDPIQHTAVAYVPTSVDLKTIKIVKLQLGPSNAITSPSPATITNFSSHQTFTVTYHDMVETWKVSVVQTQQNVKTVRADGWVRLAWLYGSGLSEADNGFEIKKSTETTWNKVPSDQLTVNGGNFSARVTGLEPLTDYVCRAYSNSDFGAELSFTTEAPTPLSNGSFEEWHIVKNGSKDLYNPWSEGGASFWDTGNKGATTIGNSNSVYTTDTWSGTSSKAAKLESVFAGIAGLGKFAAGNMFSGSYVRTDGTNGILDFGRPYTSRPVALKGHYKYTSKTIDYASASNPNFSAMKNKPDSCFIYVALTDWSAPLVIRTKPSERQLFDKNDPSVIAYAELTNAVTSTTYQPLDLQLVYHATNRKPTYILVVASASKYGDYFTGGSGSTLYLDDFELIFE